MQDAGAIRKALVSAMMHSMEAMVLSDPALDDMPVVEANPAFAALTGYRHEQIVGRNCRFLQGPGTDAATTARIRDCIRAGHGCIEWIVNYRSNGTPFWNLLFISPVRDADGRLLFFFGNQLDAAAGLPSRLDEFTLGRAHMSPETEAAFHYKLMDILASVGEADHASGLERILAAARAVSELSTSLEPGAAP